MVLRNNASATMVNYIRGVRTLMLYYNCLPEECTVDQLKAFLVAQRDEFNYSASTVNLRVCGLKYYLREVVNRPDLVVRIPNPRVQKYDTEVLSIEELEQLRRVCRDMRQRLIITLLYDTGIRVRELIRLRASDFDKHNRAITIRNSKGRKTRVVQYGEETRRVLIQYCRVRGSVPPNTLLESYKAPENPLTLRGVQHIVKTLVKRSGLKKRISPHTLRHTFAVHYLNAGGTLFALQRLLGHENLTTTLHYLKYATPPEDQRISVLDVLVERVKDK